MAYHPEQWHDFATSFAGAAGALLGLAFVAISLNLDQILRDKTLPRRAVEASVACTGLLRPWPSPPRQGSSTAGSCSSRLNADP
jgi:hypothetical protein